MVVKSYQNFILAFCSAILFQDHASGHGEKSSELEVAAVNSSFIDALVPVHKSQDSTNSPQCGVLAVEKIAFIKSIAALENGVKGVKRLTLFGCRIPYNRQGVWSCWHKESICIGLATYIFSWEPGAKEFRFPVDVGYAIGQGASNVFSLVTQVHYDAAIAPGELRDAVGFRLELSAERTPKLAEIYALGAFHELQIPPKTYGFRLNISTLFPSQVPVQVFAYRLHTHNRGRWVSIYVHDNDEWKTIARGDPNVSQQTFYKLDEVIQITTGDIVAAQCIFDNNSTKPVEIGSEDNQEMCVVSLFYYTQSEYPLSLERENGYPGFQELFQLYPENSLSQQAESSSSPLTIDADRDVMADHSAVLVAMLLIFVIALAIGLASYAALTDWTPQKKPTVSEELTEAFDLKTRKRPRPVQRPEALLSADTTESIELLGQDQDAE